MKVPSTNNLEMLVWVNARTDEVHKCRLIAATNKVNLKENQNNETSKSSKKLAAKGVTSRAKVSLEQEYLPVHERIWSNVPCSPDTPDNVHPGFSKKTAFMTRHSERPQSDGALPWTEYTSGFSISRTGT